MINYYEYEFQSPESLFAQVKEELRSYFAAGMVDDLMFDTYLNQALRKLSKVGARPIRNSLLFIDCHEAKLPPDFFDYREVWATFGVLSPMMRVPGAFYKAITTTLTDDYNACTDNACTPQGTCETVVVPDDCCDPCRSNKNIVLKSTTDFQHEIRLSYMLTPGNIATRGYGNFFSPNRHIRDTTKFHIQEGKMSVEFESGDVYLSYYSKENDCDGNQLVPVNYRIEQYIMAHLKCKIFEFLWNTTTDESFNQAFQKYQIYEQKANEAFILADIEMKKETIEKKAYKIRKEQHRNDGYKTMLQSNWYRERGPRYRF